MLASVITFSQSSLVSLRCCAEVNESVHHSEASWKGGTSCVGNMIQSPSCGCIQFPGETLEENVAAEKVKPCFGLDIL